MPTWSWRGRKPTRVRLVAGEPEAQSAAGIATQLPAKQWQRYIIKEGTEGPIIAYFAALRVVNSRNPRCAKLFCC